MTRPVLLSVIGYLVAFGSSQQAAGEEKEKTERRKQAVLRINGDYTPKGFVVQYVDPTGPAANLDHPNNANVRGIMDKGDTITHIEGKTFRDRREFLDLLNDGHARNKGTVRITVKDVTTGDTMVWIARPVVVEMDVPVKRFDLLAELGDPVREAPAPPVVPPVIDP